MMDYQMFKEIVKEKIKDYMPPEYRNAVVDIFGVNKVNGIRDALALRKPGEQIAPNLYLDDVYKTYQQNDDLGVTLQFMAEEYSSMAERSVKKLEIDMSQMKDRVVMMLVNTEQNKEMLADLPHREFQDLSVIYRYVVSQDEKGLASFKITNEHLAQSGMTQEELFQHAAENASRPESDYVMEMPGDEFLPRTKLSGIQKTYYARVCRVRRLAKLPYSKAWQYRDEIRKMQRVHEQYLFLVKNDIHSLVELVAVKANLEAKNKECQRERRELNREKKRFEPLFEIAGRMKELQAAENSFIAGDDFFLPEHNEYQTCAGKLEQEGYTLEETEALKKRYKDILAGNYERKQAVYQSLRLARGMEAEIAEAARNIQREEKKQEVEQKNIEKQEQPGR